MNEQTLFLHALDQPPGEQRQKWLEKECQDIGQRERISNLLKRHEAAGNFLERPPAELREQPKTPATFQVQGASSTTESNHDCPSNSRISKLDKSISKSKFVDRLIRSKLMTAEEVAECNNTVEGVLEAPDARAYAQALVKANVLTSFQAKAIYEARIKGLTFGEYIILDQLGKGGMGIVYKAKHRRMDRLVAIKVLPRFAMATKGLVGRFYREVKTAGKLMHPNIVAALDASDDDGLHYLVMEYVEGQDLGQVLRQSGPLELSFAVDCVIQAARGLQYAHEQGVIHRDIKPANLLLDGNGVIKILDMGLARVTGAVSDGLENSIRPDSQAPVTTAETPTETNNSVNSKWEHGEATLGDETRLTKAGEVMGTLDYMSPEQFSDSRIVDERGDIYSLGCTLYRLLTNQRPFQADNAGAIYNAHRHAPIPSIRAIRSDVPAHLDAVFQRMLAKEPRQRQNSMSEVIEELAESLARQQSADAISCSSRRTILDDTSNAELSNTSPSLTARPRPPFTNPHIENLPARRRSIPVGWIAIGSLAASLLVLYVLSFLRFTGSEAQPLASNADNRTKSAKNSKGVLGKPNGRMREIANTPLPQPAPKPEFDDGADLNLRLPHVTAPDKKLIEAATNNIKTPASPEPDRESAKTQSTQEFGQSNSMAEHSNQEPFDAAEGIAAPWNGTTFSWSSGLPRGGFGPFANGFVEFDENGQAVSISQNDKGITVSVDGRIVEAANPAALRKKDEKAYQLYEKTFGSPDMRRMPLSSAMDLQRDQLENLLKMHSGNPLMKSVLEKMLQAQDH